MCHERLCLYENVSCFLFYLVSEAVVNVNHCQTQFKTMIGFHFDEFGIGTWNIV